MVYCGERVETEDRVRNLVMAMGPERSKPPLHNFDLPFLKWGNQRQLRCMKLPADSDSNSRLPIGSPTVDRHRSSRSPPSKFFASRNLDASRFRQPRPRFDVGDGEEGIEAVGQKMILDLKTAADRMKDEILGKRVSDDDEDEEREEEEHDEEEEEEEQGQVLEQSPPPAPAEQEVRPWNLRTRRPACKAPMMAGNSGTAKGLRIEERKASNNSPLRSDGAKSPRLRAERREKDDKEKEEEKEKEKPRVKFAVGLSRKEIEEDFMQLVGHRPARRPKKRPRIVQKQLDSLFPGLWLTEVTVDTYKVPELPDSKR